MNKLNKYFTISIRNGTNRVISSSEDKFAGIGNGSLIKIGEENNNILYTVIGRDKFSYIKQFQTNSSKILIINDNTDVHLQVGDTLQLSYKEYELMMIYEIINKGTNYSIDDEITIKGGSLNIDPYSGMVSPTVLKVNEVDAVGGVLQVGIQSLGKYVSFPSNPCSVIGGNGKNLELELKYKEIDSRTIIEREIQDLIFKDEKTYIYLNNSLPVNIENGKLYVEKTVLVLNSPYSGPTASNLNYEIFKNFTPYLRLPFMVRNSTAPEVIFNNAMVKIDEEISAIKKKLNI